MKHNVTVELKLVVDTDTQDRTKIQNQVLREIRKIPIVRVGCEAKIKSIEPIIEA